MHAPGQWTEFLGQVAFHLAKVQPFVPTYLHLLGSAVLPIYAGAHSSLSRPSSAAKSAKKRDKSGREIDDGSDKRRLEGLSPFDAILFPVLAGITLASLYFIIKWLKDPAILNVILNVYFAGFSVFAVSKMVSDGLDVFHSFLFPHDHVDKGILFQVDAAKKLAVSVTAQSNVTRTSPLPGPFSRLPLPQTLINFAWYLHVVPSKPFRIRAYVKKIVKADVKIGIHGLEGLLVGLTTVLYFNFVDKPWFLTNLMGFGFAYGSLQILSPTTFWTGTLVLSALFFYDIYFVFFTPMMVTVAQSIEIPAKLLFPRPADPENPAKRAMAMLGLGDIVLPGIMIGLALRFDLYMYYLKKQVRRRLDNGNENGNSTKSDKADALMSEVIKAPFQPVDEGWGDRFWTAPVVARLFAPLNPVKLGSYRPRNVFPKPYFHASICGYILGMLATLAAMQISDHPQPALLYLVPGVVGSLWLTGAVRGETSQMWNFADDEADEVTEKPKEEATKSSSDEAEKTQNVENDARQNAARSSFFSFLNSEERVKRMSKTFGVSTEDHSNVKAIGEKDDQRHKSEEGASKQSEAQTTGSDQGSQTVEDGDDDDAFKLFYFSVTAPKVHSSAVDANVLLKPSASSAEEDRIQLAGVGSQSTETEPDSKRIRIE